VGGSRARAAVALAAMVCFEGCTATATIVRNDSPNNEAEILQSDERALYVQGAQGRTYRIGRESVITIDHPGNVEAVIGGILLGFGGALVVGSIQERNSGERIAGAVYAAPGLLLLAMGLYKYVTSKSAASAFENAEPLPPPFMPAAPPMVPSPALPYPPAPAPPAPAAPAPAPPPPAPPTPAAPASGQPPPAPPPAQPAPPAP
jgi:hypothetical protein